MASPTRSTPPTIVVSNTIRSSGYEVEPPIRAQSTQMGMGPITFPFLTSGGLPGSHHLPPPFITYGRCYKNHRSRTSNVIVLDGCGEFMPLNNTTDPNDPSFFICDACGCHRSFHREHMIMPPMQPVHNFMDYLCPSGGSLDAPSPIPVSSSDYPPPPLPHMFWALNPDGLPPQQHINNNNNNNNNNNDNNNNNNHNHVGSGSNRSKDKRPRSKFSVEQTEKMLDLAGRIGWKIQKNNDEMVMLFCNAIGVPKSTFKIWIHNNKNKHVKRNNGVNGSPSSS